LAKVDGLLRNDAIVVNELGFAPLDDLRTQLRVPFVAAADKRRSLGRPIHNICKFLGDGVRPAQGCKGNL